MVYIGAGLPILPGLAGESKSYAERLLSFPDIGTLGRDDAFKGLRELAHAAGVEFKPDALAEAFALTKGYPYFLQEWGYQCWNIADASPITIRHARQATPIVMQRLDKNFFRVRYGRLTIYSPAHGDIAFTVPLFNELMVRAIPKFNRQS